MNYIILISLFILGCSDNYVPSPTSKSKNNSPNIGNIDYLDRFIDKQYNIICYRADSGTLSCVRIE